MSKKRKKQDIGTLLELVTEEINASDIIIAGSKPAIISGIVSKVGHRNANQNLLFDIKMLLFRNRYDNVDKDKFFAWLNTTHVRELSNSCRI